LLVYNSRWENTAVSQILEHMVAGYELRPSDSEYEQEHISCELIYSLDTKEVTEISE